MSAWSRLDRELDAWRADGQVVTLWLRDDDACRESDALARLLDMSQANRIPLALAVIPARLEPGLVSVVAPFANVTVLQHGYAHHNHAPPPARRCELGAHRPLAVTLRELAEGMHGLARHFGARFVAALVPPWNRIDHGVIAELPQAGYRGLSAFGPRATPFAVSGLPQCNTHVDVVASGKDRAFIGSELAIDRLVGHLQARRTGSADAAEPTGILTHHLDLDDAAWRFVGELMQRTGARDTVAWLDATAAFATAVRGADVLCGGST